MTFTISDEKAIQILPELARGGGPRRAATWWRGEPEDAGAMFKDASPEPPKGVVSQSRRLRRTMSLPEVLLWRELRAKPNGLKFRRRHPTGPYSLDFYCAGIETLRIPAQDVLHDLEAVLRGIAGQAIGRLPLHHPAAPGGSPLIAPPPACGRSPSPSKLGED